MHQRDTAGQGPFEINNSTLFIFGEAPLSRKRKGSLTTIR